MIPLVDRYESLEERCTVSLKLRLQSASGRVPQRLGLAPHPSIRLATRRRLLREMLETGFCHRTFRCEHPCLVGSRWGRASRARELQTHVRAARLVEGRATEPHRVSRRESGLRRIELALERGVFSSSRSVLQSSLWRPCRFAVNQPLHVLGCDCSAYESETASCESPVKVLRVHDPERLSSKRAFSRPRAEARRRTREAPFGAPRASWKRAVVLPPRSRLPASLRPRRLLRLLDGASDIGLGTRARLRRFWRCLRFLGARRSSSTSATQWTTHEHDSVRMLVSSPALLVLPSARLRRSA